MPYVKSHLQRHTIPTLQPGLDLPGGLFMCMTDIHFDPAIAMAEAPMVREHANIYVSQRPKHS